MTLPTIREQPDPLEQARTDHQGVIRLTKRLVRIPSRAGIDPYEPILGELEAWLRRHRLQPRVLVEDGRPLGLVCDVVGDQPGPHIVLDACVDTATSRDDNPRPPRELSTITRNQNRKHQPELDTARPSSTRALAPSSGSLTASDWHLRVHCCPRRFRSRTRTNSERHLLWQVRKRWALATQRVCRAR